LRHNQGFCLPQIQEACEEEQTKAFKTRKFETVWKEILPYIVTAKPATDLCFTCQQNNSLIVRSVNMPESIKSQRLSEAQEHLGRAHTERGHYNSQCKDLCSTDSNPSKMHYSYDYAQNVHYPYTPQQTGPAYFKTARKCALFGICCEPQSFQVNYLIDEAQDVGKGADAMISLLHHFFATHSLHEEEVLLHADCILCGAL